MDFSSIFSPVKSPATEFRFKFTEPTVRDNAVQIKERLLAWCRSKTKEYEVNPFCKWNFSRSHIHMYVILQKKAVLNKKKTKDNYILVASIKIAHQL